MSEQNGKQGHDDRTLRRGTSAPADARARGDGGAAAPKNAQKCRGWVQKPPVRLTAPLTKEACAGLRAGDAVLLSGTIYTARDAAHKRLCELAARGEPLPFPMENAVIYYAGPTPARPGEVIGSAGPTTSYRMDAYAPTLLRMGLLGMIGKGARSSEVAEAMRAAGGVYFAALGGAGALMASCVQQAVLVCWEDLGSEAVRRLTVRDMPLTVVLDTVGGDLYASGPAAYRRAQELRGAAPNTAEDAARGPAPEK